MSTSANRIATYFLAREQSRGEPYQATYMDPGTRQQKVNTVPIPVHLLRELVGDLTGVKPPAPTARPQRGIPTICRDGCDPLPAPKGKPGYVCRICRSHIDA